MLTVDDIKNVEFSRSVGGYKPDDVDVLLDKIEADYLAFNRLIAEYEQRIEALNKEIDSFKDSQSSIQNVLVSAQRLADQIVGEAKEKSETIVKDAENNIAVITAKGRELSGTFELKAQEQKTRLTKELDAMISSAKQKAEAVTKAAEDRVNSQQMLFDKLKLEIATFKSGITAKYKEHLAILSAIPDSVPADPQYIAKLLSENFDKVPSYNPPAAEPEISKEPEEPEQPAQPLQEIKSDSEKAGNGFTVEPIPLEEEDQ